MVKSIEYITKIKVAKQSSQTALYTAKVRMSSDVGA